ncbi:MULTISPECIES: glycosyltransferase family 2 protein [unclassified Campylobacter]|uniref:glycosyltransferase family 2 protein n=1 Tax=unclassified Campylobacter TaxID=2593542 RepID=UPI001237CC7C|nr:MULTISPECIES: glycosyltransferase family 2 protein [unclassified Campylobacter]KAA6224945.1 capsular biosynthesis protein [Campylobacter sp. LR286c]KAA6228877.1 capsular biosynthesis protein [Campylobacter sp. LR196d]KAA6234042.1 capsular biosynthesis protein [Campylobacter sp. LR291e]
MTIIFPMAGLSSRFLKFGYKLPKYQLLIDDKSVFSHVIEGFKAYFGIARFLFIYRDINESEKFIKKECKKLGLLNYGLVKLKKTTKGQAHTVALGIKKAKIKGQILIFNIDTFRPNFTLPDFNLSKIDGYLEVFCASGEHWSFILPGDESSNKVAKTTEKERISNYCSSGLYYFKKASDFLSVFKQMYKDKETTKNEFYIAPMYNKLIEKGKDIRYFKINLDEIIFCGTPDEYEKLKDKYE